jgi:hypothetical protein
MSTAIAFKFYHNSLHSAYDNLKNVDIITRQFDLKKREITAIFKMHQTLKPVYSAISLALKYKPENSGTEMEEADRSEEDILQGLKETKEELRSSGSDIEEVGKLLKQSPISYILFKFFVDRYMNKIANEFEDLELLVHSLIDESGEIVDHEKMKQLLHV